MSGLTFGRKGVQGSQNSPWNASPARVFAGPDRFTDEGWGAVDVSATDDTHQGVGAVTEGSLVALARAAGLSFPKVMANITSCVP